MNDIKTGTQAETKPRYGKPRPKVPPFARYVGTSAWRSDRRRAHAYALYKAALKIG